MIRSATAALSLAVLACSTIADTPDPEECRNDADCDAGQVCAVDQGRCLPGNEAAPRAHIGVDIRERGPGTDILFRVEADGCDCSIEEEENIRELSLRRSRVSQQFFLDAVMLVPVDGGAPIEEPLGATFVLSQPSRHHQFPATLTGSVVHAIPESGNAEVDTVLRWPRYHPLDQDVPPELVLWEVRPTEEQPTDDFFASRFLALLPPRTDAGRPCSVDADCCEPRGDCNPAPNFCDTTVGECTVVGPVEWTYRAGYQPFCSRELVGTVVTPVPAVEDLPLEGASVTLRYADGEDERLGVPVYAAGDLACEDDDDCPGPDWFCDPIDNECFVALAGRTAAGGTSGLTTGAGGTYSTRVYTYCERQMQQEERDEYVASKRSYEVTVQPGGPRPTIEHLVETDFTPLGSASALRSLCVPDWGPGATIELSFEGQPLALAGADGEYTCCDVGCLPATAADVAAGEAVPERCDGRTSAGVAPTVTLESHFVLDAETEAFWEQQNCETGTTNPDKRVGSLVRQASCEPGQPCRADDVALGTAQADRRYEVRFESEPGSVVASGDFVIMVGPDAPAVQTLPLAPRVLVTGVVDVDEAVCARRPTGEDCAAREAIVLAERVRVPGEADGSVPGPYYHSISTFYDPVAARDGAFVLPLDPGGVYVVTALPLAGAEGGPAGYTVVDLREGVAAPPPLRLVLEDGVVVTLRLEQFDQRTTVIPLDRGSYLASDPPLRIPGSDEPLDLNEIGTCWTSSDEGPQGCKIRRLIPPGYDLARSQVGAVRFTARRSDEAQCAVRCPMSDPSE